MATVEPDGRRRRAQATRSAVLAAAAELFVDRGFASTSVSAIAASAGVSEQTVYYSFGTKEGLISAALERAVVGDDDPVPTLERAWVRRALADPDPRRQLRAQVEGASDILVRAAPLLDVIRSAASGSAELSRLWRDNVGQRREVQRVFVAALAKKAPLRAGVTRAQATDTCAWLLGPESYQFFVGSLQWPHSRWKAWTGDTLVRQLLP